MLKEIFDIIDKYINSQGKVLDYKLPEDLKEIINPKINKIGDNDQKIITHIKNYLKYSVNTGNKQFYNQLYSGFNYPAFIGDVITSLTNTSMYTYEVAPVATILELEMINKMNQIVGFEKGDGILLSGGSNSNLIAMFSARNQKIPTIKQKGNYMTKPLVAFASDQAHYSIGTAMNLLGLGTENLIKIKTDENGKMIPIELEHKIQECIQQEKIPFFVVATAGTTLLGAFDPIQPITKVSEKYKLWLHIDGSFGGSVILSNKYRHLFKGIEKADSFTWNPHKLMNIPLICSAILLKQKGVLNQNLIDINTDYIFHKSDTQYYDVGKKSIQCGRRVDSLKLWLSWKYYGDNGYENRINKLFEITDYFVKKVEENKELELLAPVQSLTVCFRYKYPKTTNINAFNEALRETLRSKGKSLINYGFIREKLALRFINANPEITEKDIDLLIENILCEGRLLRKNKTFTQL